MTVAFYAPLPPAKTGVADYAAALLAALCKRGAVKIGAKKADVHLYHLGNNQLHRGIYERALSLPGVVVLHDAVLHHLLLGALNSDQYVEEFVYNYGEWYRDYAVELWRDRGLSGSDSRYFRYPMLRRIAETSRAVIVHNQAASAIVRSHVERARIFEIPHLFIEPPPVSQWEVMRLRQELGVAPHGTLFGVFGYLRESKRLRTILKSFHSLRRKQPDVWLLVAGKFVTPEFGAALQPLLERPGVVRYDFVPEPQFSRLAAATDVCINLRHPSAGETSGISIRFMGMGKPIIISDSEENSRIPPDACLRVPVGVEEQEALTTQMAWLARFREAACAVGHRAKAYIREHHDLDRVAANYWQVLRECCG